MVSMDFVSCFLFSGAANSPGFAFSTFQKDFVFCIYHECKVFGQKHHKRLTIDLKIVCCVLDYFMILPKDMIA